MIHMSLDRTTFGINLQFVILSTSSFFSDWGPRRRNLSFIYLVFYVHEPNTLHYCVHQQQ
ncbi:uncharacterized protein DS421_13g402620 [Arachis hypogaea]|nr:uncharacterized protein DS421_13g402620 [Arachis hypogaea]